MSLHNRNVEEALITAAYNNGNGASFVIAKFKAFRWKLSPEQLQEKIRRDNDVESIYDFVGRKVLIDNDLGVDILPKGARVTRTLEGAILVTDASGQEFEPNYTWGIYEKK